VAWLLVAPGLKAKSLLSVPSRIYAAPVTKRNVRPEGKRVLASSGPTELAFFLLQGAAGR
jgi:hypothetical protein